ncbi:MAG: DUF1697 domain-containing protein [Candidatus Dormiibacterota bacterium]
MTTRFALLRAINLGGKTTVRMADLRQLLEDVGMANPRSLLQSGNLVFESPGGAESAVESLLEKETASRLGLRTEFFVRGTAEWSTLRQNNPFPAEADGDPSHLLVVFLRAVPSPDSVLAVDALAGPERAQAWGRHLYVTYPDGIGRSRLTMSVIETQLHTRGTARNWNTVLKLAAMAQA